MIQYLSELPSESQFAALFESTGWNLNYQLSTSELWKAIANSWYVLSAYHESKLVGFGRLVSDQVLHAMIYDLIVLPEYQNQGIGGEILECLVKHCLDFGIRDIQLFCAAGRSKFYEKRGFSARPSDAPGMQYRREKHIT